MKSYLKTHTVEISKVVDSNTGELIDESIKRHKYLADAKDEFFLGYSALTEAFMEMSMAEIRIFGYLLRYAKGVKFDITKKLRLDISKLANLNERTILNTLPSLLEKKIILKHKSGLYQLNPLYVFIGSTSDRKKELKTIIELGFYGHTGPGPVNTEQLNDEHILRKYKNESKHFDDPNNLDQSNS
jgi:hypothetical protein